VWDIRILAYYRFNQGSLSEMFNTDLEGVLVGQDDFLPEIQYENQINDICHQTHSYLSIPRFGKNKMISKYNLDLKFGRKQNDYAYTMTTWLYMEEGTYTNSDSWKAKSTALIHLEEVFYCHMQTTHKFRCFIEGVQEY
jgi:hypothetical protein